MSPANVTADTAFRASDQLRIDGPWDVFGERARRFEIHLNGREIEMIRGPILLEGYGLRLFRAQNGGTKIGFQASTDLSAEGVRSTLADADALAQYSTFPAKSIDLPPSGGAGFPGPDICDSRLWDRPFESLQEYVQELLRPFDGIRDVEPSFGSVRATLVETTIQNSAGLRVSYPHTLIWLELAVKASGGPEGPAPGEYWVNEAMRRLEPRGLPDLVNEWCRFARDVRRAGPTPTGDLPVVLPTSVLSGIVPPVLGVRLTGSARLRELAPEIGSQWGNSRLSVQDDGRVPWAIGSSPVDDEGSPQRQRMLLDQGRVAELLYDVRHAGVFDTKSTGNGLRSGDAVYLDWHRFQRPPANIGTTLAIPAGADGTDEEIIETAADAIWLQQLGWAMPDPYSGAFGGEIRIGYRIRGGKLAEPVRGGTLGGVVIAPPGQPSLLQNLVAIGSTPRLAEGILSPTLLVRPLTVAGQS